MRVLVFGDSITQGYWAVEYGWVDRLRLHYDKLQISDLENRDEPTIFNLGVSADTSENVLTRIESEVLARTRTHHPVKPAVVVQIGINDSCTVQNKPRVDVGKYKINLKKIISRVEEISSKIIFVGLSAVDESRTNPVFWGEYYYTNTAIKKYEDAMKEVAEVNNVSFVPVFDKFKSALDQGKKLLPDGLHPYDEGHKLIADIVQPALEEVLA